MKKRIFNKFIKYLEYYKVYNYVGFEKKLYTEDWCNNG